MSDETNTQELAKAVNDGIRVRQFLDDDAVKAALTRARDKYYDAFLAAKTDDERRNAQAGRNALDSIANELAITVQRGVIAKPELDRAPRKPAK